MPGSITMIIPLRAEILCLFQFQNGRSTMKQAIVFTLLLALFAGMLAGCSGTNYGYDYAMPYRGNVSTTDNGRVNGTNGRVWRSDAAEATDNAEDRARERRDARNETRTEERTDYGVQRSNPGRAKNGGVRR